MTTRRPWPDNAAAARDSAAEAINQANRITTFLLENGKKVTGEDMFRLLGMAANYQAAALRWLEREGAQTIPFDASIIELKIEKNGKSN